MFSRGRAHAQACAYGLHACKHVICLLKSCVVCGLRDTSVLLDAWLGAWRALSLWVAVGAVCVRFGMPLGMGLGVPCGSLWGSMRRLPFVVPLVRLVYQCSPRFAACMRRMCGLACVRLAVWLACGFVAASPRHACGSVCCSMWGPGFTVWCPAFVNLPSDVRTVRFLNRCSTQITLCMRLVWLG